jgi:maleate isomerase
MLDCWKAKVGWIQPRLCNDIEIYDFYRAAPKDVVLVVTHLAVVDSARKEEIEASLAMLDKAVERLNMAGVNLIMLGGDPVHLHHGNEGHKRILERLHALTKVPLTTSSQALAEAFQFLSSQQILMVSSWRPESKHLLERLRDFLLAEGIEIVAVETTQRGLLSIEKSVMTPAQIYDHVVTAYNKNPNVDGVYIQSGTMATVDIIEDLEGKTGKPVVSTNSAKIWGSFKTLNIAVGRGYGRLLSSL